MTTFAAQVEAWVFKSKKLHEAVFKESAQRIVTKMQTPISKGGDLPVKSGFLRKSINGGLNSPASGPTVNAGGTYKYNPSEIALVIAGASLGDTIYATYSANYAQYVHDGANGRVGRPWILLAAQNWQETVNQVVSELR